jgi:C1A family cysteine protease
MSELIESSYIYIQAKGIALEKDYPYTTRAGQCKTDVERSHKLKTYMDAKGCTNLENALAGRPVFAGVDATKWFSYVSGIFSDCGTRLNHAVIVTGMADQYWRLQNTWGTDWG